MAILSGTSMAFPHIAGLLLLNYGNENICYFENH